MVFNTQMQYFNDLKAKTNLYSLQFFPYANSQSNREKRQFRHKEKPLDNNNKSTIFQPNLELYVFLKDYFFVFLTSLRHKILAFNAILNPILCFLKRFEVTEFNKFILMLVVPCGNPGLNGQES